MKRACLFAAILSCVTLSAAQAQTIGTATTNVNIRSGPDPQFPVIGSMRYGQRVDVVGCVTGSRWCQIDVRGQRGWVYSRYMTLSGAVAMLPVPEIEVSQPVVSYSTPAPVVAYQAPAVTYAAPTMAYQAPAVAYQQPFATYQAPTYQAPTYQAPVVAYQTAPAVTYQAPAPVVAYSAPSTAVVETTGIAPREYVGTLAAPREVVYAATTPPRAYAPSRAVRTFIATNPLDSVYLAGNVVIGAGLPQEIDITPVPGSRFNYAYVNDYPVLVDPASRRIVYVYR